MLPGLPHALTRANAPAHLKELTIAVGYSGVGLAAAGAMVAGHRPDEHILQALAEDVAM
jgi:hypothetical protein